MVERLLAAGHNVHVLARPRSKPDPEDMLQYLQVSTCSQVTTAAGVQQQRLAFCQSKTVLQWLAVQVRIRKCNCMLHC